MTLLVQSSVTLENFEDRGLQIHGVVVNEAMATRDQILCLLHTVLHTECLNILIVAFDFFKTLHNVCGHLCLSEFAHAMEAIISEDWHDAWNNFTVDSNVAAVSHPIVENLIVEEELRDYEISSRIDLFFEISNVIFSRGCLKVDLWVTCDSDAEEITILLFNEAN